MKRGWSPEGGLIVAYLSITTALAVALPDAAVVASFHDDAFFYLRIAQNIRSGLGSTFDGIESTNGYHPLWMAALVLVAWVHPLRGVPGLRVALAFHGLITAAACLPAVALLRRAGVATAWRLGGLALIVAATGFGEFGMETPLLLLLAWSLLGCVDRGASRAAVAALAAAICLARADAVLLVLALAARVGWGSGEETLLRGRGRATAAIALPALGAVAFAALCNRIRYGHFETISAHLKTHWPGLSGSHWLAHALPGVWVRLAVPVMVSLVALSRLVRARPRSSDTALSAANVYVLVHALTLVSFSAGGVGSWYFALDLSIAAVTLVCLGHSLLRIGRTAGRWVRHLPLAIVVAVVPASAVMVRARFASPQRAAQRLVARWIVDQTPASDGFFVDDGAGAIGYLSERRVLDGDGLVAGWGYQSALWSGRAGEYLRDHHVQWAIVSGRKRDGTLVLAAHTWGRGGLPLATASGRTVRFSAGPFRVTRLEEFFRAPGHP